MKWINTLVIFIALFLGACGGTEKSSETLSEEEKAEVEQLDSMAKELEAVKHELEENTEALQNALETLE
jgi:Skp family chaperone for outer membrane proteins